MITNRNLAGAILTLAFIVCFQYKPFTAATSTVPTSQPQSSTTAQAAPSSSPAGAPTGDSSPPPQNGNSPPPQNGSSPPPQNGSSPPPPNGNSPPPQNGSSPPPPNGNSPPPQNGSSPPPQNGNSPPPQNGSSPPPQNGNSPPPQNGNSPPPENGSSPPPQNGNSPSPQNGNSPPPNSSGSPAPAQGSTNPPQSAPQTDDTIDTGCSEIDTCLTTFTNDFGTTFQYNENTCSQIKTALNCFHTKRSTCGDSFDLYSLVNYDFQKLVTEFELYCPTTVVTSCTQFNDCFAKMKLPSKKNYLIDPSYWCAVIDAVHTCGVSVKDETGCDSFAPSNQSAATIDVYCPNAFDVTSGNYESSGRILAFSTTLMIGTVLIHIVKSCM